MNRSPIGLRGCYDRPAAAQYLSVCARTLDTLIEKKLIATFTPLGMKSAVMITRAELDRYVEESAADAMTMKDRRVPVAAVDALVAADRWDAPEAVTA